MFCLLSWQENLEREGEGWVAAVMKLAPLARLLARHKKEIASGSASRGRSADTPTLRHCDVRDLRYFLSSVIINSVALRKPPSLHVNKFY